MSRNYRKLSPKEERQQVVFWIRRDDRLQAEFGIAGREASDKLLQCLQLHHPEQFAAGLMRIQPSNSAAEAAAVAQSADQASQGRGRQHLGDD